MTHMVKSEIKDAAEKHNLLRSVLRRLIDPRPPWAIELDQAFDVIEAQRRTIEMQRTHIKALDERVAKLQREADGLTSLL